MLRLPQDWFHTHAKTNIFTALFVPKSNAMMVESQGKFSLFIFLSTANFQ
jgi:hypothetical protein